MWHHIYVLGQWFGGTPAPSVPSAPVVRVDWTFAPVTNTVDATFAPTITPTITATPE